MKFADLMGQKFAISGIYKIICLSTGKFYIGSSINISKRLKEHIGLLKNNKHKNKYLQNAWNKYGEQNFEFEIIETVYNTNDLPKREKWWLNYTDCYNKKIGFNVFFGYRTPYIEKFIDLTGIKFGRLTPIEYIGKNKYGKSLFLCKCECGEKKIVVGNNLKNGHTKSCGCLKIQILEQRIKHGHTKNKKLSETYKTWEDMRQRCNNINDPHYKDYGDRGITICERWSDKKNGFKNFLEDMGEKPDGLTLDRVDNNGNYEPNNCRWATKREQARNKRNNKLFTHNGKTQLLIEWSEEYKIKYSILYKRIYKLGWSIESALTTPVKINKLYVN